jgi:long-subunit fatty acid transport protein
VQRFTLRLILIFFVCCILHLDFACIGYSQQFSTYLEVPSPFNPVGSGARALGMGGAFIAIADDATAASWNPGGLIQLEKPEISMVGGYVKRSENNTFRKNPEVSGAQSVDDTDLNYLSVAYPFRVANHNMILSLNYQRLYDFNLSWNFDLDRHNPLFTSPTAIQYEQKGALYALGLAYSAEITPRFSAGFTLNYWGDFIHKNEWQQTYHDKGNISLGGFPGISKVDRTDTYGFTGWNANLGFLWKMTEHWTLGGVFKTPFTADINRRIHEDKSVTYPTFPAGNTDIIYNIMIPGKLRMPMSYGLGLAYRFSDRLTVSGDLYRTQWEDFIYEDDNGIKTSPINFKPEAKADISNTTCIRLGGEYLIIGTNFVVPLRAGIFYDPAPAEGSPDNYYGFALGSGIAYGRFIFDVAYQFRFGNGVGSSQLQSLNFSQDVREHILYTSMIVHF